MNAVRPWRLVTDTALACTVTVLREAAQGWQALWCASPATTPQVRVKPLTQSLAGDWACYDAADDRSAPLWVSSAPRDKALVRAVLGATHASALARLPDDLAWDVIAEASEALIDACVAALAPDARAAGEGSLPRELARPGGGYMLCELPDWGVRIVAGSPLQEHRATRVSAASLADALARQPVPVSVVLGEVELSVGDVASLRAGDVVRLNTRLGDALALRGPANEALALVQPARRGAHLAVTLTDPHPEAVRP